MADWAHICVLHCPPHCWVSEEIARVSWQSDAAQAISIHAQVQNELTLHFFALPINVAVVIEALCLMLGGETQIDHAINPRQEGVNVSGGELIGQELRRQGAGDGVAKVCGVQLLMLPHHWVLRCVVAVATVIKNVLAPGTVCAAGI